MNSESLITGAVIAAGAAVAGHALLRGRSRRSVPDSMGSARWADERDLDDMLYRDARDAGAGSLPLCRWDSRRRLCLTREQALRHVVFLGPSSVGKTRSGIFHLLAGYQGSFVTSDPKSEAWNTTSGKRRSAVRYAPREPDESYCFNWIPACGTDPFLAKRLARAVVYSTVGEGGREDQFWLKAEETLLAALFLHAATMPEPTPASAYDFLTHPSNKGKKLITALEQSPSRAARRLATVLGGTPEQVRGTIGLGAALTLGWLDDPLVRRFTSSSLKSPDFSRLRREERSVYWCLPESDVGVLAPLTCLFFTTVLGQLKEPGPIPATIVLDEVANIGRIPRLANEITILRGRGVALVMGLQSIAQLAALYGREGGSIIWSNAQTKVIFHSLEGDTAEQVSRLLGEVTITDERRSSSRRGGIFSDQSYTETKSEARHSRRLMTADEVRQLDEKKWIIVSGNRPPILCDRQWYEGEPARAASPRCGAARSSWPLGRVAENVSEEREEPTPSGVPPVPPLPDFSF